MDQEEVLPTYTELELPQCFEEHHALDIAHGAAHFDEAYLRGLTRAVHGLFGDIFDPVTSYSERSRRSGREMVVWLIECEADAMLACL